MISFQNYYKYFPFLQTGIFAHPIYSEKGDYPDTVKERVNLNSEKENRYISRLPKFTDEEIESLKGKNHKCNYTKLNFMARLSFRHTNI